MIDPLRLSPRQPSRSGRVVLAMVAMLIPIAGIIVGLTLSAGAGGSAPSAATPSTASGTPAASTGDGSASPTRAGSAVPPGPGALVALVLHPTGLSRRPGGARFATLPTKTGFGSPTFVLVDRRRGPWLGVTTTQGGNNRVSWIRTSAVSLSRNTWLLHPVLTRHELVVTHGGHVVRRFAIAVGKTSSPTPTGRFAVTDRLNTGDPNGPYGCCIIALSAYAPHSIAGWTGGYRVAIHSTPESESIGRSVSHGCMRLSLADGRWLLAHIPLGTPVTISSA